MLLKLSESTAARRRIPVKLVDETDGVTGETGITFSAGDIKVSKNGGAEANHAGTVTELAGGGYYYEATAGELDTVGFLSIRFNATGCREFHAMCQVVSLDPYDGVRAGLTALPNAAADAAGGLPISDAGGLDLDARLDAAISSRMATYTQPTGFLAATFPTTVASTTNITGGTITTVTNLTNLPAAPTDWLTAAAVKADAVTKIQNGLATSTEVTSIQNNTRCVRVVPVIIERPDADEEDYIIELYLYDEVGGMEAPDSAPTLDLVNQNGTDLNSRLFGGTTGSVVSTGHYRWTYRAESTDDLDQLIWTFTVTEGGVPRTYGNTTMLVDTTAVDFTTDDRTKLEAIHTKLPSKSYLTGTANSDGDIELNESTGSFNATQLTAMQTQAAAALTAYDPPTNAEMEARTLAAASYATATALGTVGDNVTAILDDTGTAGVVLSTATKEAIATALLDLANGVETGVTPRGALRAILAMLPGVITTAGEDTEIFKNPAGDTTRVTITVDEDGNRSVVVLNV